MFRQVTKFGRRAQGLTSSTTSSTMNIKPSMGSSISTRSSNVFSALTMARPLNTLELSGLQMQNKMYITKSVLEKQVEILKNDKIPKSLKPSDPYVYRHLGNTEENV